MNTPRLRDETNGMIVTATANEHQHHVYNLKSNTLNHQTVNGQDRRAHHQPLPLSIPQCFKPLTTLQTNRQRRVTLQFRTPASPSPLLPEIWPVQIHKRNTGPILARTPGHPKPQSWVQVDCKLSKVSCDVSLVWGWLCVIFCLFDHLSFSALFNQGLLQTGVRVAYGLTDRTGESVRLDHRL